MFLKIMYWNCNGLSETKIEYAERQLEKQTCDIFIFAEHWFSCWSRLNQSTFFISSSSLPAREKKTGHENGGIAVLANSATQARVRAVKSEEFLITIQLDTTQLCTVYLPPRLTLTQIQTIFANVPTNIDILLGDVNVRFGAGTRDTRTWNQERGNLIQGITLNYGLNHILPEEGCSKNDHVFTRLETKFKYYYLENLSLKSDHGIMEMEFNLNSMEPVTNIYQKRYALSILKEKPIPFLVSSFWDCHISTKLTQFITMVKNTHALTRPLLIDPLYDFFLDQLYTLCDSIFPEYNSTTIRNQPDPLKQLEETLSNSEAIRLFKKSNRNKAFTQNILPRDPAANVFDEARSHYKNLYSKRVETHDVNPQEPILDDFSTSILITPMDLKKIIKNYPAHKSGGPDAIDTRLLHVLCENSNFMINLAEIFNIFFSCARSPNSWNQSKIHLLIKDPSEPYADKTRPIALTNILRRLYEKILLANWLKQPWARLHPSQAGFRRGFSTITQILTSDEMSRKGFPFSIFLDIKGAFDTVPHQLLLDILEARGCPAADRKQIFSLMMDNCSSVLTLNRQMDTQEIQRKHGLFQGSILSPFLFNIFIDELATKINAGCTLIMFVLFFADDIAIKARNYEHAQQLLKIAADWAAASGMKWGVAKCGIVGPFKIKLILHDQPIPNLSSYKYLGVPHRNSGIDWELYIISQAERTVKMAKSLMIRKNLWKVQTRLILYKVFIRSLADYCLPIYTLWLAQQPKQKQKQLNELLVTAHKIGLEFIFGSDKPQTLLEHSAGIGSFSVRSQLLQARLAKSINSLSQENPLNFYLRMSHFRNSSHSVLYAAARSALLNEFLATFAAETNFDNSWKTFSKNKTQDSTLKKPGVLQHYVRKRCRLNGHLDSLFSLPTRFISKALSWRSNKLFTRRLCPVCLSQFTRKHLRTCSLLPSSLTQQYDSKQFIKDVEEIAQELENKKHKTEFEYTLLDFLLNEKDYENFEKIVQELDEKLLSNSKQPP
jgi:hypothetical protein